MRIYTFITGVQELTALCLFLLQSVVRSDAIKHQLARYRYLCLLESLSHRSALHHVLCTEMCALDPLQQQLTHALQLQ